VRSSTFWTCSPAAAFQNLTVGSADADASRWPPGGECNGVNQAAMPFKLLDLPPVSTFQSLTVLSSDADASRWPTGENATALTKAVMPFELLDLLSRRCVPEPNRMIE
jgi:hypothetical protein